MFVFLTFLLIKNIFSVWFLPQGFQESEQFHKLSKLPQAEILIQDLGVLNAILSLLCDVFLRQWNNSFQVP